MLRDLLLANTRDQAIGAGGVIVAAVAFGLNYRRSTYAQLRKDLEHCRQRCSDLNDRNIELMARVLRLENRNRRDD
jgi:hypothetical protein